MITIDEKSNKEKKTKVRYLVQGDTIEKARKNVDEIMGKIARSTMILQALRKHQSWMYSCILVNQRSKTFHFS